MHTHATSPRRASSSVAFSTWSSAIWSAR
jgi:hypothetical protein